MSYRLTYAEILELLRNTVLYTPTARDIVRRSGLLQNFGLGGRGPITIARLEYWNVYGGTEFEPMSGDNYFERGVDPFPTSLVHAPGALQWIEGVSQVRVSATTITPHATAILQAGWWHESFLPELPSGNERYFPDTGELVYTLPDGDANTNTQVYCTLTEQYNASSWIDIHPDWLDKDVYVGIEMRDPESTDPVQLGLCEMQVR